MSFEDPESRKEERQSRALQLATGRDQGPMAIFYNMPIRLVGGLLLALGLVFAKFNVLDPLELARQGASDVMYSRTMLAVIAGCVVIGAALLIGGQSARKMITKTSDEGPMTVLDRVLLGVMLVAAFGMWYYVDHTFEQLGYKTSRYNHREQLQQIEQQYQGQYQQE
jgi:hypothetical protein